MEHGCQDRLPHNLNDGSGQVRPKQKGFDNGSTASSGIVECIGRKGYEPTASPPETGLEAQDLDLLRLTATVPAVGDAGSGTSPRRDLYWHER